MNYKDDAAKSRIEKLRHYADGGAISDEPTSKLVSEMKRMQEWDKGTGAGGYNQGQGPIKYKDTSNPTNWMKSIPKKDDR